MTFLLDHDVPDDLGYSLLALGHTTVHVRDVLPITAPDTDVLRYANEQGYVLLTCNRDDFLELARTNPHAGIIVVIRRKTRAAERAALVQLLDRAGDVGILGNINFA